MSITLSVLFSLASIVFIENFHRSTPFVDRLPPGREFWSHPFKFVATYGHVYKLHMDHVSAETAERRKKKVDDVQKRSRYRKAHGLEDEKGLGGWTAKSNHNSLGPALVSQDLPDQIDTSLSGTVQPNKASVVTDNGESPCADLKGKKRPIKRWLGIWE
ncbi:MAG: hypothetical protein L6R35_000207 [Caloplaca aegaea]|nr:MAG: hypothetical protein L6R35_000207 [Caloplaca aegaea]